MAGSETFWITITGKGGHGALPNQAIDPVLAGASVVTALQSIVSRNLSPLDAAVVSVTQFQAGTAPNVIPGRAKLAGTIRYFEPEVRVKVLTLLQKLVSDTAAAFGCSAEIETRENTPPVANDPYVSQVVRDSLTAMLPELKNDPAYRTMVAEDFALLGRDVPSCYFMVGSSCPGTEFSYSHHHPKFNFDEEALPKAAAILAEAAFRLAATSTR